MKFKVTLEQGEIKSAIRAHVEKATGKKVPANGVSIRYTKGVYSSHRHQ